MYTKPKNRVNDQADAAAFVVAHPFAVLCINGAGGPVVAHVPLVAVRDEAGNLIELIGHLARANPFQAAIGEDGTPVVAVFRGADAYVSPALYPTKAQDPRVVPTWAYLAAEARGTIFIERDPANMADYIAPLTSMMESHRPSPWALSDAPSNYIAAMSKGIVGLRINVTALVAKRKIEQGSPQEDYQGVIDSFASSDNQNEQILASEMTQERTKESTLLS